MKRKSKADRELESKMALKSRMYDLLIGANAGYDSGQHGLESEEFCGLAAELGIDVLARWIPAMQFALTFETEQQKEFIGKARNLEHYDTFAETVDWLFGLGVRA